MNNGLVDLPAGVRKASKQADFNPFFTHRGYRVSRHRSRCQKSMYQRHVVHLCIERPVNEVYEFLADPMNYPMWAAVTPGTYHQVGALEWAAETEFGHRIMRFTKRNSFGVLDHAVYREGDEPLMMPLRVVANENGTELTFMLFRRPDMSDEKFASTIEWITVDLLVLKGLLEADS